MIRSLILFLSLGFGFVQSAAQGVLKVSEVMPDNRSILYDRFGRASDWVELQNVGTETLDTGKFFLTDSASDPFQARLPSLQVSPGQTALFFLSGRAVELEMPLVIGSGATSPDTLPDLALWLDASNEGTLRLQDERVLEWTDLSSSLSWKTPGTNRLSPASIPGVLLWLDGSDASTLIPGNAPGTVSIWKDKSGKGNDAIQFSESLFPRVSTVSNTTVIQFDGEDDFFYLNSLQGIRTVLMVIRENENPGGEYRPLLGHESLYPFHRGRNGEILSDEHSAPEVQTGRLWLNGSQVVGTTTQIPAGWNLVAFETSGPVSASLLSSDRFLPGRTWAGEIAEVVILDRILSTDERLGIWNDFEFRWKGFSSPARALQSNEDERPDYAHEELTGHSVIRFDGENDSLNIPELSNVRTVFLVARESPSAIDAVRTLLGHTDFYDFHRGGNELVLGHQYSSGLDLWINGEPKHPNAVQFPDHLALITFQSDTAKRVNLLGSDRHEDQRYWSGDLAEAIFYNRRLTDEERRAVEGYLAKKWSIPSGLGHLNFRLANGDEGLYLFNDQGGMEDSMAPVWVPPNRSYGRNAQEEWVFFEKASPGLLNHEQGFAFVAATPQFDPPGGYYSQSVLVKIVDEEQEGFVHYTLDGSEPTISSPIYSNPLQLNQTQVLRAIRIPEGGMASEIVTETYWISEPLELPLVSIVTDPKNLWDETSGIYVKGTGAQAEIPYYGANFWKRWERPSVLKWYHNESQQSAQWEMGLRIQGGWSRANPQKSFQMVLKDEYGQDSSDFEFFDKSKVLTWDRLLFRNGGNDWFYTLMRDSLANRIFETMELDYQQGRPVNAYLNGEFWGIYNLRERMDKTYLKQLAGVDEIDQFEADLLEMEGDALHFLNFKDWLDSQLIITDSVIAEAEKWMDLKNFIHYMAAEIFLNNFDWPQNNLRAWRPKTQGGRWRWLPHDLDGGLGILPGAIEETKLTQILLKGSQPNSPLPPYILVKFLKNPQFKSRFIAEFDRLLNTSFNVSYTLSLIDDMEQALKPSIQRHIDRWKNNDLTGLFPFQSLEDWERNVEQIRNFLNNRPVVMRRHLQQNFSQDSSLQLSLSVFPPQGGSVRLESSPVALEDGWTGHFFPSSEIRLRPVPSEGYRFTGWNGDSTQTGDAIFRLQGDESWIAVFEELSQGSIAEPETFPLVPGEEFKWYSWSQSSGEGSLARNISFQQVGMPDPGLLVEMDSEWKLPFDRTSRSRFVSLDDRGIAFLNTGNPQPEVEAGYVGAVVVGLDTREVSQIKVTWTAETLEEGLRPYGLRLQYRLGGSGEWKSVPDGKGGVVEYLSDAELGPFVIGPYDLPNEAAGQQRVDLRWKYYSLNTTGSGNRPMIRLDDIVVVGDPPEDYQFVAPEIVINEVFYSPESGDDREEFIELFNPGSVPIDLAGWEIRGGVRYSFESVLIPPREYLVISADPAIFQTRWKTVKSMVGGWQGRLSNSAERLEVMNARGEVVDRVDYSDEGEWGRRILGEPDRGFRGWVWSNRQDGEGASLELIQPGLDNNIGQNWAASLVSGGSPGEPNSVVASDIAPLISQVRHFPAIPHSFQDIRIAASIQDEHLEGQEVTLYYRITGSSTFQAITMNDLGTNGDLRSGDGEFGTVIPGQPDQTIIEFHLVANDIEGNSRRWPSYESDDPQRMVEGLFLISDETLPTNQPIHHLVMTSWERGLLQQIGNLNWFFSSNAEMNGTFISVEPGEEPEVRYQVGIRMRGATSRAVRPGNRRINFSSDRPWKGLKALNLNVLNPTSQVLGSVMVRLAGLATAPARLVQVRENGNQLASTGSPQFTHYAEVLPLTSDFPGEVYPDDSGGNLYRGIGNGNLEYLGENKAAYQNPDYYLKRSNESEDDWTDLIELTRVLNAPSDSEFRGTVHEVANTEQWMRFLAVNVLLSNQESTFATGGAGDYALYRGQLDRRFQLLAYDLDALMGIQDGLESPLDLARRNPVLRRLLSEPENASLFYQELKRLAETIFSDDQMAATIEQHLGDLIPETEKERIYNFLSARREWVLAHIPALSLGRTTLPIEGDFYVTESSQATLTGRVNVGEIVEVRALDQAVEFDSFTGQWEASGVPLHPGINYIIVTGLNAAGSIVHRERIPIYQKTQSWVKVGSQFLGNTTFTAKDGPYQVSGQVVIPQGVEWTLEPGATFFFDDGASLKVEGGLFAMGTELNPVVFTSTPRSSGQWNGVEFADTLEDNRLIYTFFNRGTRRIITVRNSSLWMEGVEWRYHAQNKILIDHVSMVIRGCTFPDLQNDQHIEGAGILDGGRFWFEKNTVGTTTGYQDVIDISGAKKPLSVMRFVDNIFLGGSDDGLDMDGTDALIEGNLFMNFHRNNSSTSISSAVSTGLYEGQAADVRLFRNIFLNNDHHFLLKELSTAIFQNNTFFKSNLGDIAFAEPLRQTLVGRSLTMSDNLSQESAKTLAYLNPAWINDGTLSVHIQNSLVDTDAIPFGPDNFFTDPLWADPPLDFSLTPESPARGRGAYGLDLGANIPQGALLGYQPPPITPLSTFEFPVFGVGIEHYRYRLNGAAFGEIFSVDQPIHLENLPDGEYELEVIGKDFSEVWQSESNAYSTGIWIVDAGYSHLRINEIYSSGNGVNTWDTVEIFNFSRQSVDLSGMSLTDDPSNPFRFVFPEGSVLEPMGYVVLESNPIASHPFIPMDIGLSDSGEALFLFDSLERGGNLVDSVRFGRQIEGYSIGRGLDGIWELNHPTFGRANEVASVASSTRLVLSEWLVNPGAGQSEFIEAFNTSPLPVSLEGLRLSDHPETTPNRQVIPPLSFVNAHEFIVFSSSPNRNEIPLGFRLNSGEGMIGFLTPEGKVIDQVTYGPQKPGISQGRSNLMELDVVEFETPTPGFGPDQTPTQGFPVIAEVLALNTSDPGPEWTFPDWIEIYNPTLSIQDVGGTGLTDDPNEPLKWVFPNPTLLSPGERLLIYCDNERPAGNRNTGFSFGSSGDQLLWFKRDSEGTRLIQSVMFGFQVANYSLNFISDIDQWVIGTATPGEENLAADLDLSRAIYINEWMARPDKGEDGLELYHPGLEPMDLSDFTLTDDPQRPTRYRFPKLSFIGPKGFLYLRSAGNGEESPDRLTFSLSGSGERLQVRDAAMEILDDITFGEQGENISEGRYPDGTDRIVRMTSYFTPERPNLLDSDGDLLPDEWEEMFGYPANENTGETHLDTDLDGATNYQEWIGGTNPRSVQSRLGFTFLRDQNGVLLLELEGRIGRRYVLEYKQELKQGNWMNVLEIPKRPVDGPLRIPLSEESAAGFYRIQIRLE